MGQKVNPIGFRVGYIRSHDSVWFAKNAYGTQLVEDLKIRAFLKKTLFNAAVSRVTIERTSKKIRIAIFTARPGVIIGKKGFEIDSLKKQLSKFTQDEIHLNVSEIKRPEVEAILVAQSIAQQLERRISFKRAMKRSIQSAMRLGAKGIRINCSGRLGGAEIARMEWLREGRVPLHTLRADVDYGVATAATTYGAIGIKVWIYKGDVYHSDSTGNT